MAEETGTVEGVDDLLATLRARVAERRASGDYPPDLEARLAGHFERVRQHRSGVASDLDPLKDKLRELDGMVFTSERIATTSSSPLGERYHQAVAKAVSRQVSGILAQVQAYEEQQRVLLELIIGQLGPNHLHSDLIGALDAVLDHLDISGKAEDRLVVWYDGGRWAERFEGAYDDALRDAASLVGQVPASGTALVLHAGRGEAVEALAASGADVSGVESDPALADSARRRGLAVVDGGAAAALRRAADGSLGSVWLLRGLGRLGPAGLLGVVAGAARALRPGGHLVLAGLRPASAAARTAAASDPHWLADVDPGYVEFLLDEAGFTVAEPQDQAGGDGFVVVATR